METRHLRVWNWRIVSRYDLGIRYSLEFTRHQMAILPAQRAHYRKEPQTLAKHEAETKFINLRWICSFKTQSECTASCRNDRPPPRATRGLIGWTRSSPDAQDAEKAVPGWMKVCAVSAVQLSCSLELS